MIQTETQASEPTEDKSTIDTTSPSSVDTNAKKTETSLVCSHVWVFALALVIFKAGYDFNDVQKALAFYGVYHSEPMNQLVHFFGVPGILWSMFMFIVHLPIPFVSTYVDGYLPKDYPLTYGTVVALFYLFFYLKIDPFGGTLYAPVLYAMYVSAVHLRKADQAKASKSPSWMGTGKLLQYAFALHVFSWYIQIHWGHKIFEGAQPALFESVGGALTVAPLFAFYEGLWAAGINKDLQRETQALVEKYTIDLCAKGSNMRVCETLSPKN